MQSHFANLFNIVVLSSVASIGMVTQSDAATFGRGAAAARTSAAFSAARTTVTPKPATPAAPPAAPAAPAKPITTDTPAPATPPAAIANKATKEPARPEAVSSAYPLQKAPVSTIAPRAHEETSSPYYGYHYYNWFYSRPANITPLHRNQVSTDPVITCIKDRLYTAGVSVPEITSNIPRIEELRRKFDVSKNGGTSTSTTVSNSFDMKVYKAYRDCTNDW